MSETIQVIAIITPAEGKAEILKEALTKLAEDVRQHEPGVSRYQMFEQFSSTGVNVIVVQETYKDKQTYEAHSKSDHFQALAKRIGEESLLAAPLDIKTIKPFAGFDSRS